MKVINWFLTTTMVLPGLNLQAQTDPYNHGHQAVPTVKSETLNIDTKSLYLNNASNSPEATRKNLEEKRSKLSQTHKKLGNFLDQTFKDMSQDYNLLNFQTGMTFWEEFQALQNKDFSVIDGKYGKTDIKIDIAEHIKPKLIHFMTWMRANGLATFKSLNANDKDGMLQLESLLIKNAPYEIKGPTYVVTKFKDVEEALNNPETFSVRNYKRMDNSVGPFMLANDKKEINHEHPWMRGLIDVKEMETRIRPLVRSILESELKSREYIKKNPFTNEMEANIELVNDIARRVPAILTIKYFGFEGFSPEKIMEWSRATQDDFFHNIPGDPDKLDAAKKAGQEMQSELVKLVDAKFKNVAQLAQLPAAEQVLIAFLDRPF